MNAQEVALRLNARRVGHEYRSNCPSCGYHRSFSIRGRPNEPARVSCFSCCDRDGITRALNAVTAGSWRPPERLRPETEAERRAAKLERARALWNRAQSAPDSPVATYLASRGLAGLEDSRALRYAPSTGHPQGGPKLPAMLALVVDVANTPTGVHRTYLRADGSGKADVEPAKASLGLVWGSAIRLHRHDPDRSLIIGEGIETAASAGIMLQAPAWSAISAGNLGAGLQLPPDIRDVVIAADCGIEGETRAQEAAARWLREKRRVRIARPRDGDDFNDCLLEDLRRG